MSSDQILLIMSRVFISLISAISLLAVTACSNSLKNSGDNQSETLNGIQFPDSVEVKWTYLMGEDRVPGFCRFLAGDSSLYVLGNMGGQWVHEFNANTGEEIGSYVNRVSHVGELSKAFSLSADRAREHFGIFNCGIYDRYLISFSRDFEPEQLYNPDSLFAVNDMLMLSPDRVVTLSLVKEGEEFTGRQAINILDIKDGMRVLDTFDESPSSIPRGISRELSVSPSGRKLATVTPKAGYLEMFDLSGDSVSRTFINNYFPLEIDEMGVAQVNHRSPYGFRSVAASDDYVYAAYSTSDAEQDPVMTVGVWKWDGTPVKKMSTDRNVCTLAVAPDGSRLYCIAYAQGGGYQINYIDL